MPSRCLPLAALGFALVLAVVTLPASTSATPATRTPAYWGAASCLGLSAPDDDELVRHSLVVLTPALSVNPVAHAPTQQLLDFFFSALAHDYALKYCPRVTLLSATNQGASSSSLTTEALPREKYDCDIIVGDVPFDVSKDYAHSKQPLHGLIMADPIETTLADFHNVQRDPSHPRHAALAHTTLHAGILRTAALPPSEQAKAGLLLNPVTWRLCGPNCHPSTMSLEDALVQAKANLNTRTLLVLTEHSPVLADLARMATASRKSSLAAVSQSLRQLSPSLDTTSPTGAGSRATRRRISLATNLSAAEVSILETANHADRVLFGLVLAREADQRRCVQAARTASHRPFRL
jgi:hypothetical protein